MCSADMFAVHPIGGGNGDISQIEAQLLPGATALLDKIVWWAKATMVAKSADTKSGDTKSGDTKSADTMKAAA